MYFTQSHIRKQAFSKPFDNALFYPFYNPVPVKIIYFLVVRGMLGKKETPAFKNKFEPVELDKWFCTYHTMLMESIIKGRFENRSIIKITGERIVPNAPEFHPTRRGLR